MDPESAAEASRFYNGNRAARSNLIITIPLLEYLTRTRGFVVQGSAWGLSTADV